jgi:Mn2+/Fe2+ NRAMP family transporter
LARRSRPWGLAFIQSYAADKRLRVDQYPFERVDVIVGAAMTGVIGVFVIVACAATLHARGIPIREASDAARALEPLAGHLAAGLFGVGFVGAALLAASVVPLSTAYSVAEAFGKRADIDDSFSEAPLFYCSYGVVVTIAVVLVLLPGAPLLAILVLSQALNAVLLRPHAGDAPDGPRPGGDGRARARPSGPHLDGGGARRRRRVRRCARRPERRLALRRRL